MYLSTKEPEEMLADEVVQEVASILARAIIRENERGLTGLMPVKKHSCDDKNRGKNL